MVEEIGMIERNSQVERGQVDLLLDVGQGQAAGLVDIGQGQATAPTILLFLYPQKTERIWKEFLGLKRNWKKFEELKYRQKNRQAFSNGLQATARLLPERCAYSTFRPW